MGVFAKTRRIDSNRCAVEFNTITVRQTPLLHWEKAKTRKSKYRRFCTTAYSHWGSKSRNPQVGGEVNREETDPIRLVGGRFELGTTELVVPHPFSPEGGGTGTYFEILCSL
jgi:hypothetical protein